MEKNEGKKFPLCYFKDSYPIESNIVGFQPPFYVHSGMRFSSLAYISKVVFFSVLAQCQLCADYLLFSNYVSRILQFNCHLHSGIAHKHSSCYCMLEVAQKNLWTLFSFVQNFRPSCITLTAWQHNTLTKVIQHIGYLLAICLRPHQRKLHGVTWSSSKTFQK